MINNRFRTFTRLLIAFLLVISVSCNRNNGQTEILKWKDGKSACITLTFDDGTQNHYEIAIPYMNKLNIQGTFFINTLNVGGSDHYPTFVGRPVMDILEESGRIPTNRTNLLERTSMIRYLMEIKDVPELDGYDMYSIGHGIEHGNFDEVIAKVDNICRVLRNSGKKYIVENEGNKKTEGEYDWNDLRGFAADGHEFASHTISHPYLSVLDEKNALYELEKCQEDIGKNLGFKHTLTVECPYGIHDKRIMKLTEPVFPFSRNQVPEEYITGIMRSGTLLPGEASNEYIQWQRGPLSDTPYPLMRSWIETTRTNSAWLVLVFHGIEGIGWEALPAETIRDYFNLIKENENELWIATYQDAYKYVRARMNTVITTKSNNKVIHVNIDNELDPKVYDVPLSVRTVVPNDWVKAEIRTGEQTTVVSSSKKNNQLFVEYEILPGLQSVDLHKAN
ncbi:MAG: polysaccharide deacetylase family protein [Bacteroidales bacterium]|nr:polysaccharide deacetylase family protein [Bacteroidales bacterium]